MRRKTFLPFEFATHRSEDPHNHAPSIDRPDPQRGYEEDAMVVLTQVNSARGEWSDEQMSPVLELILVSIVHHTRVAQSTTCIMN